jgi:hypothetical protein
MQAARSRLFSAHSARRPLSTLLVAAAAGSSRKLTRMSSTFSSVRQRVKQQLVQEATTDPAVLTVHPVTKDADLSAAAATASAAAWARVNSFKGKAGEVLPVPDASGGLSCVVLGLGGDEASGKAAADAIWAYAALPGKLPAGTYSLAPDAPHPDQALLGWILGEDHAPASHISTHTLMPRTPLSRMRHGMGPWSKQREAAKLPQSCCAWAAHNHALPLPLFSA